MAGVLRKYNNVRRSGNSAVHGRDQTVGSSSENRYVNGVGVHARETLDQMEMRVGSRARTRPCR